MTSAVLQILSLQITLFVFECILKGYIWEAFVHMSVNKMGGKNKDKKVYINEAWSKTLIQAKKNWLLHILKTN